MSEKRDKVIKELANDVRDIYLFLVEDVGMKDEQAIVSMVHGILIEANKIAPIAGRERNAF